MSEFIKFRTALLKSVYVRPFSIAAVREIDRQTCELFVTTFNSPIIVDGSIDSVLRMIAEASGTSYTATGPADD